MAAELREPSSFARALEAPALAALLAGGLVASCVHGPPPRPEGGPPPVREIRWTVTEVGEGLPRAGQWRDGFAVADLDGDGHLDLVHGPVRKGSLRPQLFRGRGDGGFERWTEARFPATPFDYGDAAVGDWNRDGVPDVAFAMHLLGVAAFLNEGRGVFSPVNEGLPAPVNRTPHPGSFGTRALEVVDWNGDGWEDLVVLGEGPSRLATAVAAPRGLRLFLNRNGAWQEVAVDDTLCGTALAVADLDQDGRPDVVASPCGSARRDLLRLGRGDAGAIPAELPAPSGNGHVWSVAAVDQPRRSGPAVLVSSTAVVDGAWRSRLEKAVGSAVEEIWSEPGDRRISALAAGDLGGDGTVDLVAGDDTGRLLLFSMDPPALLLELAPEPWRAGCTVHHLELADLDDDGSDELVASFAGETSAFNLGASCPTGGGLQAWRVTRLP